MSQDQIPAAYELVKTDNLEEYRSMGHLFRHKATGCSIYHIVNDDEENLFAYSFRTPPEDSTGIAHILEHTVLCGSERYPVKDPFLSLLKGSMYTFLNAMTYPDKTIYPAGSVVEKDFFNLFDVYGDAVFFPLLKEEAFRQEGHHLEITADGELDRVGIVYNEMKGNYSSEESIAAEWSIRSLFPENAYGHDSGGDPEIIPQLTYESFRDFHRKNYHPSNCQIVLYGNIPSGKILDHLEKRFLSRFERGQTRNPVSLQNRWQETVYLEKTWPSTPGESLAGKTTIAVNWLTVPAVNTSEVLAMTVLADVLMGHSGSPLEMALVESGLGEDISPISGLESDINEVVFTVALRGSDPDKRQALEDLIENVLREQVQNGINKDLIEGALRQIEFRLREIRSGTPFGLRLIQRALKGWNQGADPVATLSFTEAMKDLRQKASRPRFFEELIQKHLLDNQHRSVVTVRPDPKMASDQKDNERKLLAGVLQNLNKSEIEQIKKETEELRAFQEAPDSAEALKTIPFLKRSDLPKEVITIDSNEENRNGIPFIEHEVFTNGISYIDLFFDVSNLNEEESRALPLFCRTFTRLGLPGMSHDQVMQQLALKTGGVGADLESGSALPERKVMKHLYFRGRMLNNQADEAIELINRLLTEIDYSDTERIKEFTRELRNDFKAGIIPSGSHFAALRSGSRHSDATNQEEQWHGISQFLYLDGICRNIDSETKKLAGIFQKIREKILCRDRVKAVLTCEGDFLNHFGQTVERVLTSLPDTSDRETKTIFSAEGKPKGESLTIPAQVGYIAVTLPAAAFPGEDYVHQLLMAHLLRTGYLWEQIRMKGGAYGASCSNSGLEKALTFTSYRDPNVNRTLSAFKDSLSYISEELTDESLDLALIGSIGKELRPLVPSDKGMVSFKRKLYGMDDSLRQQKRDIMLSCRAEDIKKAAKEILKQWDERTVAVLAGSEVLASAAEDWTELKEAQISLPV